jgi:hypothetical protein
VYADGRLFFIARKINAIAALDNAHAFIFDRKRDGIAELQFIGYKIEHV